MIIALDGPAGSGKSSVAQKVAQRLNIEYLDTGALYRVITYYLLESKKNINNMDSEEVKEILLQIKIEIIKNQYYLNGININENIREPRINENVSEIASNKLVRENLLQIQRNMAKKNDMIIDGRDIGTVVFPKAEYKFYLDATPEIRAKRRYDEENFGLNYNQILEGIIKRDKIDKNREIAPLLKADDAIYIDTTLLKMDEVINEIIGEIKNVN